MTVTTPTDPHALALLALAATLSDERRASRFLDLTGLSPDGIRSRLDDPGLLASCLSFLEAHEPDLLAVSEMMGVAPERLIVARQGLEE